MFRSLIFPVLAGAFGLLAVVPVAQAGEVFHYGTDDVGLGSLFSLVGAAAPGDVILLEPGNYLPISPLLPDTQLFVSRGIALVGDGGTASVGLIRVSDVPAGETVVLRGLAMGNTPLTPIPSETLLIENCAGTVVLEDCLLAGTYGQAPDGVGLPGMVVRNSAGVVLTRCTVRGGDGRLTSFPFATLGGDGGTGLLVESSSVALVDSTVEGGDASPDSFLDGSGYGGGDAIRAEGSVLSLAGAEVFGGDAGDGSAPAQAGLAAGGDGFVQSGAGAQLRRLDTVLVGGAGGAATDGASGPNGDDLMVFTGSVHSYPGVARTLELDVTLRAGETGTLTITGPPGEQGKVMLAVASRYAQLSGKKGVWTLGEPAIGPFVIGVFPPSGVLTAPVPVGSVPGVEGFVLSVQGFSFGVDGLVVTNPTESILLAAGL